MFKKLSAVWAATAAAVTLGCFDVAAADTQSRSKYYTSAVIYGTGEDGEKGGFPNVTDITGVSAVTFTFRVDESVAKKAINGEIDFTGSLGTESSTFGRVAHEWSFVPYQLDSNGEVVYSDDLKPVSHKELTMEKITDGYYCVTLEEPTGFFKDDDKYARIWFDCNSDDYSITLTGVVLSFDDSKIVRDLKSAKIEPAQKSVTYTGKACKPAAKVTYGSKTLKEGTDYTLSYKNNTNTGTATVTATGKGKYKGTVSGSFTVKRASVANANVAFSSLTFPYTGSKIKPTPTVKVGSNTLTLGKDYTLSYTNNINIGIASVKITGTGNYSGSVTKTFTIVPKATTLKTLTSPSSGSMKATWSKNTSGEGYQVIYSTSSNFSSAKKKVINSNKTASATISSLTKGSTYYVKVRAFKKVSGKYVYGAYSKVLSVKVK
ncbi:fibronectin type III domain-containing protein [Ruminococcus sp. NK3A76]|uniref:fibronectin type III domain-containing protein n=1 Tax=Ruminococcus sp. NK3A76 TaxID=877411 RepID=UPI0004903C46|nr:fibronectin type III domain-containing protein [Ruminococcus sp. NK3A76]